MISCTNGMFFEEADTILMFDSAFLYNMFHLHGVLKKKKPSCIWQKATQWNLKQVVLLENGDIMSSLGTVMW